MTTNYKLLMVHTVKKPRKHKRERQWPVQNGCAYKLSLIERIRNATKSSSDWRCNY